MSNSLNPDQANILSGLIWVQTVCKGYKQTTLADKDLKGGLEKFAISTLSYNLAFILCVHIRSISVRHAFMVKQYKMLPFFISKITSYLWLRPILERRFPWFGHVERFSGAVRTACDIQIDGRRGAGRLKLTWKKLTEKDCREWKLTTVDPQERSTRRSGVRSAMGARSQLPGKRPTDVDDAPAPAC